MVMIIIISILIINTAEFDTSEFKLISMMKIISCWKRIFLKLIKNFSIYVLIDEVILHNDEI